MTKRPGVLLDVDGTLLDSNYLHTVAWSRAFSDAGEVVAMNAIHRLVGMGGGHLVETLIGRSDEAIEDGWQRYYEELLPEVKAFPGAHDLLVALREDGVAVVLATSSPGEHVEIMLDRLQAHELVSATTSSDDADATKPAPDIFEAALAAGSIDRTRALVVGDSTWDVQAARAAGLGCLGVETGGFSRHELGEEGCLHVYRDVGELCVQRRTSAIAALLR